MYLFKLVFFFFLDMYLGVELLDDMAVLVLIFLKTSKLFSIVVVPIYILISSVQGFPVLCILFKICYLYSF